ncbi:MAG: heme-copper oxidase subunit III [Dehalococcoidia bacterium]
MTAAQLRTPERLSPQAMGMALFILSESVLFSMLFVSYFYLRSTVQEWPPEGVEVPRLASPLIATVILLSSSATMAWAERRAEAPGGRALRAGLAATFLLGAVFLSIQGREWLNETMSVSDSAYASLFFTITGFHGAHVIAGLGMNAFVQAVTWKQGRVTRNLIRNVSWYWHFVDVVWLFVIAVVYISPRLMGG